MRLKIRTKLILSYCLVASIPLCGILALPAVSELLLRQTVVAKLDQASDDYYGFLSAQRDYCQKVAQEVVSDATVQRLLLSYRVVEAQAYLGNLWRARRVHGIVWNSSEEKTLAAIPDSPPGSSKLWQMRGFPYYVMYGKAAFRREGRFAGGVFVYAPILQEWSTSSGEPVVRMTQGAKQALREHSRVWREIILTLAVSPDDYEAREQAVASDPEAASRVYLHYKPALVYQPPLSATGDKGGEIKHTWLQAYIPLVTLNDDFCAIIIAGLPLASLRAFYQQTMLYMLLFSGAATLVALLAGTYFSSSISRRIGFLARGARRVSEGTLDFEIKDNVPDELGALASTFNTMTRRLESYLAELRQRASLIEEKNRLLDLTVTELTHVREFVENVLRQVGSGVFTVNSDGRITQVNPACLQILAAADRPEPLVGAPLERLLSPGALPDRIEELLRRPDSVSHWETVQLVKGRKVPLEVSISPLEIQERNQGLVVTIRDLSVIRGLEESVRRSEKLAALGHLSAGMAHEIRNPLGIIKGSAELLEKKFSQDEDARDLAHYIIDESIRLSRTLQDFLDFARPREPSLEPTSINQVLLRTLPLADHHPLRARIGLEMDLAPDLPEIMVDAAQCQQVFLNLLLNAFEASPRGGVVKIASRLDPAREEVVITVEDTGVGIAEEELGNIFNPFFTTKTNGTGLGLSIVHRIMESHQGLIGVESRPGQGTTFTLRFPASRVPARPESVAGPAETNTT